MSKMTVRISPWTHGRVEFETLVSDSPFRTIHGIALNVDDAKARVIKHAGPDVDFILPDELN